MNGTPTRYVRFAFLVCLIAPPAHAQNSLEDIPAPDPNLELASFKLADGFEVNLWASDPLLAKPTQISFDREGRLWVSTSETYPQLNVNQDPSDRIVILEDTNHDGEADKSSVFYDQLLIPGGVLPDGTGGAFVAHAEQLLHLTDTDQDGMADRKQVLLSGFGTEDTHHTLHRLRWGPGGKMFMLQGYYIGTHVETLYGPRRLNGGGLWSYDTRTRRLEIYSRGLTNPWGIRFDRWGQSFQTDGAGGEGINYSFPDAVFRSSPHENRFLNGLNPGRPKLCGLEIISGGHFPPDWQGSLLTNDFRANNIDRYTLQEQASGYTSTLQEDLLQSTHVSFRPIDIVMGPDGAIYVADWYSPIIQHGEVDFRDQRRDQVHGRIWRITAKDRPLVTPVTYSDRSVTELLDLLKADEDWVRLNAKQELKEHDEAEVESNLQDWLKGLDPNNSDYERHKLEGLWTYQTISTKRSTEFPTKLLESRDHRVRAAAIRVLYDWHTAPTTLKKVVNDPHPRVRREAVTTLGQLGSAAAAQIAMEALDQPMDYFLDFALWRTIRKLEPHWLPAFQRNELIFDGNANRLAFALKAIENPEALSRLLEMLQQDGEQADPAIVALIGKVGRQEQIESLFSIASTKDHPLAPQAAMAILEAADLRRIDFPDHDKNVLACSTLLKSGNADIVSAACRLVGLLKVKSLKTELFQRLSAHATPGEVRRSAARGLADLAEAESLRVIAENHEAPLDARIAAAAGLVRVDTRAGAAVTAVLLATPLSNDAVDGLMRSIMFKRDGPGALANELVGRSIPSDTAILATRIVETSGNYEKHSATRLRLVLADAAGLKLTPQQLTPEEMSRLLASTTTGSKDRGKEIYNQGKLTCVQCHAVMGAGSKLGPDLSSIGAAAPVDYLIESLIAPSKKIKEGYRMTVVLTVDGEVMTGTIVREDENMILMRDSTGKEMGVSKRIVETRETSPVSMMPSGLTAHLREDEFADLIAYLASLGKN